MKKSPRVKLVLQALAFSMKGLSVTSAERQALADASRRVEVQKLTPDWRALVDAARLAARSDPYTEEMREGLCRRLETVSAVNRAARALSDVLAAQEEAEKQADLAPPASVPVASPAWLSRKDING